MVIRRLIGGGELGLLDEGVHHQRVAGARVLDMQAQLPALHLEPRGKRAPGGVPGREPR